MMNFEQKDIFYNNQFNKIMQIDPLANIMGFVVFGIDAKNQYKICIYNIENGASIQFKSEFFFRQKIIHAYMVVAGCVFSVMTENTKKVVTRLHKYEIIDNKLKDIYVIELNKELTLVSEFKLAADLMAEFVLIG